MNMKKHLEYNHMHSLRLLLHDISIIIVIKYDINYLYAAAMETIHKYSTTNRVAVSQRTKKL